MRKKEPNNYSQQSNSFALPKSEILRGRNNFDRLFSSSKKILSPSVSCRYRVYSQPAGHCLIAFIAKKKLGTAVKRNRMKRLMREAYRKNKYLVSGLFTSGHFGLHFVLMARSLTPEYARVERDVITILEELRTRLLKFQHD